MKKTYSIYEAKARFSEIVRLVREQRQTVTLSYHGQPVAEIRPLEVSVEPTEQRLRRLESEGVLQRPLEARRPFEPIATKRGALKRFLNDRDS